ncbi:MAG: hypothetical protein ABIP45_06380 [Knoellia sp.]
METKRQPRSAARSIVSLGHLLVGTAAIAFAVVLIVSSRAGELDGILLGAGLVLALAGAVFTWTAIVALRRGRDGGGLSLSLSLAELVGGAAMAVGMAIAVQGYGAFEPWRSPLMLPSALLIALGLGGLRLEVVRRHLNTSNKH